MKNIKNQVVQIFKTSKTYLEGIRSGRNDSKESRQDNIGEEHSNEPLAREEITSKASVMKHHREKSGDTDLDQGMHI